MGARIHAALAEPYASFAEALITGERSTIPPEINKSLLISGLYHILSISGLHMWLAAGGVFWALRAALALVPGLALRYPIRKWAAAAALLMGLFYMLLADWRRGHGSAPSSWWRSCSSPSWSTGRRCRCATSPWQPS